MEVKYRHDLDLMKGLAIIAVVLYHAGWCKSGYLGVDVFLVINGYLVVPKVPTFAFGPACECFRISHWLYGYATI